MAGSNPFCTLSRLPRQTEPSQSWWRSLIKFLLTSVSFLRASVDASRFMPKKTHFQSSLSCFPSSTLFADLLTSVFGDPTQRIRHVRQVFYSQVIAPATSLSIKSVSGGSQTEGRMGTHINNTVSLRKIRTGWNGSTVSRDIKPTLCTKMTWGEIKSQT